MPPELSLSGFIAVAENLAERYLSSYTEKIRAEHPTYAHKEVNDALWGTITLTPIEVALLDSPLLQRLRYIRQLGVAHWIYPGAVHSRFEHTIGVLYQIQRLITALNTATLQESEKSNKQPPIDENDTQLLRICALLHDIGHAAFSHVSEKALESLPAFSMLSRDFSQSLSFVDRGEDKQLSEILAYYIVQSPAMRSLLDVIIIQYSPPLVFDKDHNKNLNIIIEKISRALIGRKIDDKRPLLHELISGPFDADKLDYLVRDAKLSGTPSLLDIPRLVQKLTTREIPAGKLPQDLAGQLLLESEDEKVWLFGIKISGKSVLDELQLARVLAYAKIYRHPKIIAIEQMIRAFIEALAKVSKPAHLFSLLYTVADDALLSFNQQDLQAALKINRKTHRVSEELGNADATLKAIRDRRLWVRAFQLNNLDIIGRNEKAPDGMFLLNKDLNHPQAREDLVRRIRDETFKLLQLDTSKVRPSRTALDSLIMIRVLSSTSGETQTGRAFLIPKVGSPLQLSLYMKVQGNWVEQYMVDQPRAYIFSPTDIADIVYIAIERIVRKHYEFKLSGLIAESSKRDKKTLQACKKSIPPEHWRGIPYDIHPPIERLQMADIDGAIQRFDRKRSSYQEPEELVQIDSRSAHSIPKNERTMIWLQQFGSSDHADCALHLLDCFKVLTREDTTNTLRAFLRQNKSFQGAWVAPFGGAKDSSSVQTYFTADLPPGLIHGQGSLEEYEKRGDGKPLIFIDDFIGSGGQATDILATWFGRDDLRRKDLGEEREALGQGLVERLTKIPVAFIFVSGWNSGIDAIKEITAKIGLNASIYCHIKEKDIPFAEKCLQQKFPNNNDKINSFLLRCQEIGSDLARSQPSDKGITEQKVQDRALGYGGKAMLMASFLNVPTQTLSAIWMSGTADNVPWSPLLRRRKKL
jgi:HD superfamily phosphohydrolase